MSLAALVVGIVIPETYAWCDGVPGNDRPAKGSCRTNVDSLGSGCDSQLRGKSRRRYALRCARSENAEPPSAALRGLRRVRAPGQLFVRDQNLCPVPTHGFSLSRE